LILIAKPDIGSQEKDAVARVLDSGMLAQGKEVASFESEFSDIAVDSKNAIAVNSGTSALIISLMSLGLRQGAEVIVPSFTFAATANAVVLAGGIPVFADIDPVTFCIDPAHVESLVTKKTQAIMPVHLYGQPADMQSINKIARKYDLLVIEDASQAHLGKVNGEMVGTLGDAAAFSFYPTKNMTSGEGGMITTASAEVTTKARMLRNQGMLQRYQNEMVGFNNRMTDIHAAIGRVQLSKLQSHTLKRRSNAEFLSENIQGVVTPKPSMGTVHVFHQYTINTMDLDRDRFSEELTKRGIGNDVYYPTPVHKLAAYNLEIDLPVTQSVCKSVLSIPVHPLLSEDDLLNIVAAVNTIAKAGS
jgi:dTDP-4-amino-4,6-dideoxygalactose transaminase